VDDDPSWVNDDEEIDVADDTLNCDVAAEAMDRIALALGPKTSLPAAFEFVNVFLTSEAQGMGWKYAHAAFNAISQVRGGAPHSPMGNEPCRLRRLR
jgi:hypothetical protein